MRRWSLNFWWSHCGGATMESSPVVPQEIKIGLQHDSVIPPLGVYKENEISISRGLLHSRVHCSIIYCSQGVKTALESIST